MQNQNDPFIENLWDSAKSKGMGEPELLVYRSNLLGSDKRVTNYGGGNTSAKVMETDPLTGSQTEVLWVKGSGGDVGTIGMDGFATLYMDKLISLKTIYRGVAFEDEMVGYLSHCTFNLNPRAASIDTPLHAYAPFKHVDHMHPDAVIAIAAAEDGERITQEIYGDEIGWLPWKRPGFELGLWIENFARENPNAKGVVLGSHGLFTWADDAERCYGLTIDVINKAIAWFDDKLASEPVFGGAINESLIPEDRRCVAERLMPLLRGMISQDQSKIGHFSDAPEVLDFVNSAKFNELAPMGTSCPDHFLRTKIRPLVIRFDPTSSNLEDVLEKLPEALEDYREGYTAYYERCKNDESPAMRDPNAVVYLVPGVGMITFAKDKATARVSGEFYINAINVMRRADGVTGYRGLPEQEAFNIEYWLLEEAKLRRLPTPKSLVGKVALITGAASGIGRATADRFLREGACVVMCDVDSTQLAEAGAAFADQYGIDVVRTYLMDVTDEAQVIAAFTYAAVEYGGIDILVSSAGISSSSPVEETSIDMWNQNMSVLSTGYFLVAREGFRQMIAQNLGGSVVFIASKNALAASPNASAYCTAKASEVHLARCLALEGAPKGIRVNVINPDAVLQGSKIWTGDWRKQRAEAYDISPDELEEHYRKRSLLKKNVFPEDIAEAVYFFASEASSKSTGNIINVDAGNAQAFTR